MKFQCFLKSPVQFNLISIKGLLGFSNWYSSWVWAIVHFSGAPIIYNILSGAWIEDNLLNKGLWETFLKSRSEMSKLYNKQAISRQPNSRNIDSGARLFSYWWWRNTLKPELHFRTMELFNYIHRTCLSHLCFWSTDLSAVRCTRKFPERVFF